MKHKNSFEKGQLLISPENQSNKSFINGLNGRLNYNGREMSFTNSLGTKQILSLPTYFNTDVKEIIGDFDFEDELILFTKSSTNNIVGHVWSVKEISENNYSFTKIHEGNYNFTDGLKLNTVGVNENSIYKRVYFTDGVQPFRSINVNSLVLSNLSVNELNMFPETSLSPPTIVEINNEGALKPMIVQYCYRLVSFNGNVTKFSMFSERAIILNNYTNIKSKDTAGIAGDNLGKNVKINISGIDYTRFKTIECFALLYEVKDVISSIKLLGKINLSSTSVSFNHIGTEADAPVSINQLIKNSDSFETVKVLKIYQNLLLSGNVKYKAIKDYNFDPIIQQSDSNGLIFSSKYNPDTKIYKFIPGTTVYGGESINFKNGNGIRISFTTEEEELSVSNSTISNLPNANVSQAFKNENKTLTENYDLFGNKSFNQSIRYSPNKASYQRGEVYRIAFKATKNNKKSFVKYIGDIKIPSIEDNINYLNGNTPVYSTEKYKISKTVNNKIIGISIYIKVDIRLPQYLIDDYDFIEILRVKRDSTNKTIIDQGVLFPTADFDETYLLDDTDQHFPSGYQYRPGVQLPEKISFINYTGLYMRLQEYKLGNVYSFDSPRIVRKIEDYTDNGFNKIKILSSLKLLKYENKLIDFKSYNAYKLSGYHYWINTGNYHRHVLYGHNEIPTRYINVNNQYFAGSNQILPSGSIPEKDLNQLGNFGLPNWSCERQQEGIINISKTDIDTLYDDNIKKNRFRLSTAEPTLFLKLNEDYLPEFIVNTYVYNNFNNFPFLNTLGIIQVDSVKGTNTIANSTSESIIKPGDKIISNLVLVNLERDLSNQYGGLNDFAISQNQYISIHKKRIVNIQAGQLYSMKISNGDIYIDMFHHQKFSLKNSPDISFNLSVDSDKPVSVTSSFSVAIETSLPQIFAKGDKIIKSGINVNLGETYFYNEAYISEEAKVSIPKPFNFEDVIEFPNLIQVSNIKLNGDQYDAWSIFNPENFHELDLNKGAITNLIKIRNLLFATQLNEGLSQLFINSRAIIPSADGRKITVGTSSPVNIEHSKEISKYGTSFFDSVAISNNSFIYFNDKYNKIILYKNEVISITDATFNQNNLYEKLKGKTINYVNGVYDERYKEMILSIFYNTNERMAISYSNEFNLFNGNTDFISKHYINFKNKVFAVYDLKYICIKNEGPKGKFFGIVKNFELEFIVNPSLEDVKIFDNFIGIIKSSNVKIKEIRFSTNLIPEQVIRDTDLRYKIREGRHLFPYKEIGKSRMRGDYMKVKIIFLNFDDIEISINSILTTVRKSFK